MENMEEVRIAAPTARSCRICATEHDPCDPHDRDSLYYQIGFWQKNKRFPTWEDAMSHCTEEARARFRAKLAKRGVEIDGAVRDEK